jgi:hypothetical protein
MRAEGLRVRIIENPREELGDSWPWLKGFLSLADTSIARFVIDSGAEIQEIP